MDADDRYHERLAGVLAKDPRYRPEAYDLVRTSVTHTAGQLRARAGAAASTSAARNCWRGCANWPCASMAPWPSTSSKPGGCARPRTWATSFSTLSRPNS